MTHKIWERYNDGGCRGNIKKLPKTIDTETAKGHDVGQVTAGTIGMAFDFDEISRECSMKDPTFKYEACDLIKHRNTDARYPFRNDCNETNCILMHLLRVIGPMLVK